MSKFRCLIYSYGKCGLSTPIHFDYSRSSGRDRIITKLLIRIKVIINDTHVILQ